MQSPTRIVCFGSLNIDKVFHVPSIVQRGETIACTGSAEFPGGKGANQSVALARAASTIHSATDIRIQHVGQVGKDGKWLVELLAENNVDTSSILVSETETSGCALIQKDASGDNAIILLPAANASIPENHITDCLEPLKNGDWLLLQNETNSVREAIHLAHGNGAKIAFNPAPCPPDVASYPLHLVHVLILNEGEARTLFQSISSPSGSETTEAAVVDILTALMNTYSLLEVAIVTLGENGSSAAFRSRHQSHILYEHVDSLSDCAVVDTTGAGDTFVGFFLATFASLSVHKEADVAFKLALDVAAVASGMACEKHGAIPSIPHRGEVEKRLIHKGIGRRNDKL